MRGPSGFATEEAFGDWELFKKYPARLPELARERGRVVLTGEDGLVRLPVGNANILLFAETEQRFGLLAVRGVPQRLAQGDPVEFELPLDPGLRVAVVDQGGRPVGQMPVALLAGAEGEEWRIIDVRQSAPGTGEVRFSGFQKLAAAQRYGVRTALVGASNPVHEWPGSRNSDPIEIEVPPHGTFAWELLGQGGADIPGAIWLQALDEEGDPLGDEVWRLGNLNAGVWPGVALGVDLELRCQAYAQGLGLGLEWHGPGPVLAGEKVVAGLQFPGATQFVGQLVFADPASGETLPVPRFSYGLHLLDGDRRLLGQVDFLPDEDGNFSVRLPLVEGGAGPLQAEIVARWVSNEGNRRVRFPLQPQAWDRPGTIEAGSLQVRWVPHSIVGQVVDQDGQALEGVTLQAPQDRLGVLATATTDAAGKFSLNGVWNEPVPITLAPGQDWTLPTVVLVEGDFEPIQLRLMAVDRLK